MRIRKIRSVLFLLMWVVLSSLSPSFAEVPLVNGIGGAGALYCPSISPYDPNLMFVASDMGGVFRSVDGGGHWNLIHFLDANSLSHSGQPAFFPDAIVWYKNSSLLKSQDKGETWYALSGPWGSQSKITGLAASPEGKTLLLTAQNGIYVSADQGDTWERITTVEAFSPIAVGGTLLAVQGPNILFLSEDEGKTWSQKTSSILGGGKLFSIAGGTTGTKNVLFGCHWKSGLVRSYDMGDTWEVVDEFRDQRQVLMPSNQVDIVYAYQDLGKGWCKTVYKTENGGESWKSLFKFDNSFSNVKKSFVQTQLKWGYYITRNGFGVSNTNPDLALLATQGELYLTRDGGKEWVQVINEPAGERDGERFYRSIGLEITTTQGYYKDPSSPERRFIAYSDIGLARSEDGGQTWTPSIKGIPWNNTVYSMAFSEGGPGKIYAAASALHDIPGWTSTDVAKSTGYAGGVVVSDNGGKSWRPIVHGLPQKPCTDVEIIEEDGKKTLLAGMFGAGVYKSTDGGRYWRPVNAGLGFGDNKNVVKLWHDKRTGATYCLVSALHKGRDFPFPGGLWRSPDLGESWVCLTEEIGLKWPSDFWVDPGDDSMIYLSSCAVPGVGQAGIWKTTDGGKTWKIVMESSQVGALTGHSYDHFLMVSGVPGKPEYIYAGTQGSGLWLSRDGGTDWAFVSSMPFNSILNIDFVGGQPGKIVVSTFGGGIWVGDMSSFSE